MSAAPEYGDPAPHCWAGTRNSGNRFLVGLGVLVLLGAAGESVPIVCTVDDAHLLDAGG